MRIEVREKVIPEYKKKETVFVAIDGTEFKSESDCKKYDQRISANFDVIKHAIDEAQNFDGEYATLYNIQSEKDLEAVIAYNARPSYCPTTYDYDKYGPGYYIYFSVEDANGCEDFYLLNYDKYHSRMNQKMVDMLAWNQDKIAMADAAGSCNVCQKVTGDD